MKRDNLFRHEDLLQEKWEDSEFRSAYRRLKPRYDAIRELIILRSNLRLSQEELAERVGSHQSRISKIESAENDPRLSTLVDLADAMNADVCIQLVPRLDRSFFSELQDLITDLPQKGSWEAPKMPAMKVSKKVFA